MRKAIKQLGVLCLAVMFVFLLGCDKDIPQPEDLPNGTLWTTMEIMPELMWKLPQKRAAGLA